MLAHRIVHDRSKSTSDILSRISDQTAYFRRHFSSTKFGQEQTDAVPLYQTDAVPLHQTDAVPLYQTDAVTLYQTDAVPLYRTDVVPLYQTDAVTL